MKETLGLVVTDSSPLIALAAADSLHLLTMPGLPVMIPDMVYHETTRHIAKLGASAIVDWVRRARPLVTIEPTSVYAEYQALVGLDPKTRARDRGEQSASEVLGDMIASDEGSSAILLFEDSDLGRRKFINALPERVMPLSTSGYLKVLEEMGWIASTEAILDQAMANGRDVGNKGPRPFPSRPRWRCGPPSGRTQADRSDEGE